VPLDTLELAVVILGSGTEPQHLATESQNEHVLLAVINLYLSHWIFQDGLRLDKRGFSVLFSIYPLSSFPGDTIPFPQTESVTQVLHFEG